MKTPLVRFIGMQETGDPALSLPLFNTDDGNTWSLATCIDRLGDFRISNHADFVRALAIKPTAIFNSILHAQTPDDSKGR